LRRARELWEFNDGKERQFDGKDLRGLEQNPDTKSRWAAMARNGKKVMQLLEGGKYIAVVADGKVHLYGPHK
jgi:hypothetical protein